MVRIHKEYQSLKTGSLQILSWEENILTYGRFRKGEQIVVIINNRSELTEGDCSGLAAEVR